MLLVQSDGFLAVAGFGDDFHVGLLVDHGRQAVTNHRVIIRQDHPNLLVQHRDHQALRLGNLTRTRVPEPG